MGFRMNRFCTILCLIFISYSARGQGLFSDFTSPITTEARYITFGGLTAATLIYMQKSDRTYRKTESFKDAKFLGRYGKIGNYAGLGGLNAAYAIGHYWYGKSQESERSILAAKTMAKATLYSTGLTIALKSMIKERRPGYPEDNNSFPSGHSSASFAFASVVTANHGWYWGGAAYTAASFISFSRINDDFHYLHDVIFGMTIGAAYGWGIYYNQKNDPSHYATFIPRKGGGSFVFNMEF
jgi:membrane-associated phospholipid phosphatase